MLLRYAVSFLSQLRLYRSFPGDCHGCFRGVYKSFDEAIADAPKTKRIGYDHQDLAEAYADGLEQAVRDYDYPVLFWLQKLITNDSSLLDFGGNVGTHYSQYRSYLDLPDAMRWTVFDLPEIVRVGKKNRKDKHLSFTDDLANCPTADIVLASGVLQYIEDFSAFINSLPQHPQHLIINRLPLYDGQKFVTLQNGGDVFYPQYVFNRADFIGSTERAGYRLVDEWIDRVDSCVIPFHSENSLSHYAGLYLELERPRES